MFNIGKKSILQGFIWKLMERFGVFGIQFVLQIILARLLSPENYGALSIMIIFTTLANVFIQNGFNTSLIQNKDVKTDDYSSVLWVSLCIAGAVYLIIFLLSPYIGQFYNMPHIVVPLRVLALILFPGSLNSIQLAKISREMDFKTVFISNIIAVIISGFIGIIIAFMGGGLWALVFQNLLNISISCIIMYSFARIKFRFICDLNRVKILFKFGWKLLVSSLIDTLYQDLSSLVIGKKYNSGILGYNNQGKQFPQFIVSGINGAVQSVMLPALSSKQDNKNELRKMMRNSIIISAYIIFPMMAGIASIATPLVKLLLTDKWLKCVPYIQIYCFSYAFYPVHSCNLQAINAMGRSDIFLKLEIIKKSYGIIFLTIAVLCFDSPLAIAMTGLFTTWISWFVNAYPNKKLISYSYKDQILDIAPSLFISIFMCIIVYLLGTFNLPIILTLVIQIVCGIFLYIILSMMIKPEPYKILLNLIKKFLNDFYIKN